MQETEEKSAGNNARRPADGNRRDKTLPLRTFSSGIPVKHIGLVLIRHGKIPQTFSSSPYDCKKVKREGRASASLTAS